MEIVNKIRLFDGSEHASKQQAERHMHNILSTGTDLKLFEEMANLSALKVKSYFVDNYERIFATMQAIAELKEIEKLNSNL